MIYLRCSSIIFPDRVITDGAVIIDGEKIAAAGPAAEIHKPLGLETVDAHGLHLAPGYIDWQLNGGFGLDFSENPSNMWQTGECLPEHGVTSFLPTIISSPLEIYKTAQENIQHGKPANYTGAQPLGLHFEGPYLNPEKKGAHNPRHLRKPDLAEIANWTRKQGVWVVTLAPELPHADDMIRFLSSENVIVSAGHSMASYEQAMASIDLGVSAATHLFNAMPGLDHRTPGLAAACIQSGKVTAGIIPDGIHVHPAMVNLAWRTKQHGMIAIVTDAMTALGMPPGTYGLGDFEVIVDESSARLKNGTLAGSILRMDQAVRNMMTFCGCSLPEAVNSASLNAARLIKAPHKGRILTGADADLVLLDAEAAVISTFVRGRKVFSKI
ncbi:MAG: N-acetylglucosamine-6-phosphate deacetylase [Chloroflexota bacterium]